jgi:hypothetical protein
LHGHSKVVRILVESVGIKFNANWWADRESAVTCACQNGHDEVLEVLFELGARVNETALRAAIRSGSLRCVEQLLKRKVPVNSDMVELATACGHADVLGRLLRVCLTVGDAWLIAWLDGFGDGQRLLEAAGARPTWMLPWVKLLMERPGKAAEFAGIVPLPETMVVEAEWKIEELQAVVTRLLHDGTASAPLLRALIERNWSWRGSPFGACSDAEFARLELPSGLRRIGNYAFYSCSRLIQIAIPWGVDIGTFAFHGCSVLAQVVIPPSAKTIGNSTFYGCAALVDVQIPDGVTSVQCRAFRGCRALTQMEIPPSVRSIGASAFHDCSGLEEMAIPSGVKSIGQSAFSGCSALMRVEIPSSVNTIGKCAFAGVILERLTLVGASLSPAVVAALRRHLSSTAKVVGADLGGRNFGKFTIAVA